jgi:hypothetical protein
METELAMLIKKRFETSNLSSNPTRDGLSLPWDLARFLVSWERLLSKSSHSGDDNSSQ